MDLAECFVKTFHGVSSVYFFGGQLSCFLCFAYQLPPDGLLFFYVRDAELHTNRYAPAASGEVWSTCT